MNKEQLIKTLLKNDLNQFRFSVWATFNDNRELEYALCLKGEKPYGYDIPLCSIGGNPDSEYSYEYIEYWIDYAIDEFYARRF